MSHWLVALFCMVLAVGSAVADDRANLIGTWKLAGGEIEFQDTGERRRYPLSIYIPVPKWAQMRQLNRVLYLPTRRALVE